jgi:AcrR family transcriptional regulator
MEPAASLRLMASAVPNSPPDRTAEEIIPGGTGRPEEIPPEIFEAALATFVEQRRLDMRALAGELGMGRATLYRKVGNRDRLLGEVVWFLTRRALAHAVDATSDLRGAERVVATVERFMTFVNGQADLRRLLEAEPEAALRILTSKEGPVQQGIVEALERLLADEEASGRLQLTIDRATLAFIVVRIGESFLYADVIADNEPDVGTAIEVVRRLLREQ